MEQSQWRTARDYRYLDNADGRPAGGPCRSSAGWESLLPCRLGNIPASPPAEPDPPNPAEPPTPHAPPRTPDFPPDKEPPGIDVPPPDVVPVPVREPPTMSEQLALRLTGAAAGRRAPDARHAGP